MASAWTVSEVSTKRVAAVRVVGLREQIESFREQGRLWKTLNTFVAAHKSAVVGAGFAVHYNLGAVVGQDGKIDVEVCIPVGGEFELPEDQAVKGLKLHELPALDRAAFVTLSGSCVGLGDAYTTLFAWMKTNGETQGGPTREIYLTHDVDPMSEDYRCEVQVPLA